MMWRLAYKGSPVANRMADRHYSTKKRRAKKPAKQVGAPGRLLVLVTTTDDAFWISREQDPVACKHAWPGAWECSAFRNEGAHKASHLIREAVAATMAAWGGQMPDQGFVTFVDPSEVREKKDPGHCFVIAGFRLEPERTKKEGHLVFRLDPKKAPKPEPAIGAQGVLVA